MDAEVERLILALRKAGRESKSVRRSGRQDPVFGALEAFRRLRHTSATPHLISIAFDGGEQELLAARLGMSGLGVAAFPALKGAIGDAGSPRRKLIWTRLALATSAPALATLAIAKQGATLVAEAAARDFPERVDYVPPLHLRPAPAYGRLAWDTAKALLALCASSDSTVLKGVCRVLGHAVDERTVVPLSQIAHRPEAARDAIEALCDVPSEQGVIALAGLMSLVHIRPAWITGALRHRGHVAIERVERALSLGMMERGEQLQFIRTALETKVKS